MIKNNPTTICDRCGVESKEPDKDGFVVIGLRRPPKDLMEDIHGENIKELHLCNDCTRNFHGFMSGHKVL